MKLLRFKVNTTEGFRSLQAGFEVYFLRDFDYQFAYDFNPNILAGRNGSGKSNILEALANIFYHLDCMYNDNLPDGFLKSEDNKNGFDNTKCIIDAFELEYFVPIPISLVDKSLNEIDEKVFNQFVAHILIIKLEDKTPSFEWLNREEYSNKTDVLGKIEIRELLPKYVLGYSSGENELLSLPFFKTRFLHFDEYKDKLIRKDFFGYPPQSEGRLVYLDNQFSQAILLANFLMQDENVLAPFIEEVELVDLDEFRLIICKDKFVEYHENVIRDLLKEKELSQEQLIEQRLYVTELTSNLNKSIEDLKKCATCFTTKFIEKENETESREYLVLDYKVDNATKEAFRFHFANEEYNKPLQLFQLFQILLELNAYVVSDEDKKRVYESKNIFINHDINPAPLEDDRILRFKNLWIKKKGIEKALFTKELSDGEHQFLHSLGLCLLFKDENCLFLLDEPETHFNPDWRAKFISSIRHCFSYSNESVMREMLITTHSPFLISDTSSEYVHIFRKDSDSKSVSCVFPDFQTLGSSVNKITIKVFDKTETIGEYAQTKVDALKAELDAAPDKVAFLRKVEREIGDSVERVLFINQIIDQIETK